MKPALLLLKVGDRIRVIDTKVAPMPMLGTVLELDDASFFERFAKIRLDNSPAWPAPEVWVNIRNAALR